MKEDLRLKKARIERPDKAAFSAFIGIFLLIFGICFGVWAYWTYGHYRAAFDYAEALSQNQETLPNITKSEKGEIIRENQIFADHDKLEALWTGAVGLVGLSLSALLFIRAFRIYRRLKRSEYEEVDWEGLGYPTWEVKVLYRRSFSIAAIFFYIFFGGLTLLVLFTWVKSDGSRMNGLIIGLINLAILFTMSYLLTKGKRKSVKSFDPKGVMRNDGRHFPWSDFRGSIPRIASNRYGHQYNWRTELVFANGGEAWLIPQRIKNYDEIYDLVEALPQAVLKETQ